MNTKPKHTILATILGVAIGITITALISYQNQESFLIAQTAINTSQTHINRESKNPELIPVTHLRDENMRNNENRIQSLEQRMNSLTALMSTEDISQEAREIEEEAAELNEITPEEARAKDMEWWQNMKTIFEQEPTDDKWSKVTSELFISDISQLSEEKGFSLIHTKCRTTQCEVILEWPSFDQASIEFSHLLHHEYKANCARYTLLPEPIDGEDGNPYEMTMIFDCSDLRESI